MFYSHLFLLLYKNLIVLWRSKGWLIIEFLFPIIIFLLERYAISFNNQTQQNPVLFQSIPLQGNESDTNLNIRMLSKIWQNCFDRTNAYVMYASSKNVDNKNLEIMINEFKKRYPRKISLIKMNNESDILNKFKLEYGGKFKQCNPYIVSLYFDSIDSNKGFKYKFIEPANLLDEWYEKNQWIDGGILAKSPDVFPIPKTPKYWISGILTFQVALNDIFLEKIMNYSNKTSLTLQRMPIPSSNDNMIFLLIKGILSLWQLTLSLTVIHTVREVVSERESKMKAYLHANGVKAIPWFLSHFIISLVKIYINITIMTIPILSIFSGSKVLVFCMIVYLFGFSLICLGLFISSFCKTSTSATSITIFIIGVMYASLSIYMPKLSQRYLCFIYSLNIFAAFDYAFNILATIEQSTKTFSFWSIFYMNSNYFTIGNAIFMLLFDGIVMLMLTFILDALYPKDDSVPMSMKQFISTYLPVNFDFSSDYDRISLSGSDSGSETIRETELIWDDNSVLEVRNLTKTWKSNGQNAVDGISFSIKKGHISVLLGHNGAGKSTTFSILTGITAPTGGDIKIFGKHLFENLDQFRKNIGYCPQSNPIFNNLTVSEQLKFVVLLKKGIFGKISGKLSKENKNYYDVVNYLEKLKLIDKENEFCSNLSGGMKRKLSVCMALCGGCELVFLDEPTAGMDVDARQDVTTLLNEEKKSRAILLTTHYMDEADSVGDRIIIMGRGRILCDGSSAFLKKKFGTGYQLTFTFDKDTEPQKGRIYSSVRKIIESAEMNNKDTSGQFSIILPIDEKVKFSKLFSHLEYNKRSLGFKSFGLSLNTLEQVFLKVGELADGGEDETDSAMRYARLVSEDSYGIVSGVELFVNQLSALIRKQYYYYKRNFISHFLRHFLFIMIFVGIQFVLTFYKDWAVYDKIIPANIALLGPIKVPLQDFISMNSDIFNDSKRYFKTFKQFNVVTMKPYENMTKYLLNDAQIEPQFGIGVQINSDNSSVTMLFNGNAYHSTFYSIHAFFNIISKKENDFIKTDLSVYYISSNDGDNTDVESSKLKIIVLIGFLYISLNNLLASFVDILVDERVSRFKHQQLLTKLQIVTYWFSFYIFNYIIFNLFILFYTVSAIILSIVVGKYGNLSLLCILFYFADFSFICWLSFLFKKPSKANSLINALHQITPLVILVIFQIVQAVKGTSIYSIYEDIFKILIPGYNFIDGLLKIKDNGGNENIFDWETGLGKSYAYFCISMIINLFILFLIQSRMIRKVLYDTWNKIYLCDNDNNDSIDERDDDVLKEIESVNSSEATAFPLMVNSLAKNYGKFRAVNDLSFVVSNNDCFGLLGINGAGKTSTFNMLTGTSLPTSGEAFIKKVSIDNSPCIGYCPQFDALLSDLSPYESMNILSQLNGFIDYDIRTKKALESVDMMSHSNKKFKKLSGGQRRKISLSIAIMANAGMIFLDEPTAGIDPKARRSVWNLLTEVRKRNQSILLTSHSMDECEILCTRIGFMNKGKLSHIGTSQHLKSKFGSNYILEISFENPCEATFSEINTLIINEFNCLSADIKCSGNTLRWNIPKANLEWSNLYKFGEILTQRYPSSSSSLLSSSVKSSEMLENLNNKPAIKDYSITQNSLEQVFLHLSAIHEKSHRQD
uniref:ABC transporter domain-containing protein n=1 Tax=Parastrongyloides trichosuri TaxID=131310 RepID=A0A0N5A4Y3_PARTI